MTRRRPLHTAVSVYDPRPHPRDRDELLHVQRQARAQGGGQVQEGGKETELLHVSKCNIHCNFFLGGGLKWLNKEEF